MQPHLLRNLVLAFAAIALLAPLPMLLADDLPVLPVEVLIGPTEPAPENAPAPGPLRTPFAVEFDSQNQMWIVEFDGGRVLRCPPNDPTKPEVIAGPESATEPNALGYVDGPAREARFNKLHNLVIDGNDVLYLSDHANHSVRRLMQNDQGEWIVDSFAGHGKSGPATDNVNRKQATFREPICITLDAKQNRLLIADIGNQVVRSIDLASGTVSILAGQTAKFRDPRAVELAPDGRLLVLERNGNRLRRVEANGSITTLAGSGQKGKADGDADQASFNGPKHMDVGDDGLVFIADDVNHVIRVYDPHTDVVQTLNLGEYTLRRPHGVCIHNDQLYIADSFNHRILRVPLTK
ncbi:hypothetical protein RISK_004123 [Rhodopirellula islandica]|uniref:NHL repeat containing protein n=1 Tax=Rhodopirellula islandica TaxID=595434 RepID=A0A0J1BB33_RHOIS|nr:hypothetical protein [Rhodopirellula islandica]KLU03716.1 hypothetical protein RISK_004123 [Rhodopirellula islandica]